MDEKLHKSAYGGFSIVSVVPTRFNQFDPSTISKIKSLQALEALTPQEISIEFIGKAGKSLHGKPYSSAYLLKYFEKSKTTLGKLSNEPDFRPPLIKFTASKENRKTDENLSYRMFQSDVKLIKTIFENSGLQQTEGHDWNIL